MVKLQGQGHKVKNYGTMWKGYDISSPDIRPSSLKSNAKQSLGFADYTIIMKCTSVPLSALIDRSEKYPSSNAGKKQYGLSALYTFV